MILSFSHINRQVRELDRTIAFYVTNLGFYVLRRYRRAGRSDAAYIGLGDVLFELSVAPEHGASPRDPMEGRLGLTVTDLDGVLAELQRNGVEIIEEAREMTTFWGRQAAIKDPDGYVIALREWAPPDGPHFDGWEPRHDTVERIR